MTHIISFDEFLSVGKTVHAACVGSCPSLRLATVCLHGVVSTLVVTCGALWGDEEGDAHGDIYEYRFDREDNEGVRVEYVSDDVGDSAGGAEERVVFYLTEQSEKEYPVEFYAHLSRGEMLRILAPLRSDHS